jgi:hypothetical protein
LVILPASDAPLRLTVQGYARERSAPAGIKRQASKAPKKLAGGATEERWPQTLGNSLRINGIDDPLQLGDARAELRTDAPKSKIDASCVNSSFSARRRAR